jgi:radical SAM protein
MDFSRSPLLVIWEVTQACDLACAPCRSSVSSQLHPGELTTEEAFDLFEKIKEFGNPLLVLTGGDPFKRPDLFDIIRHNAMLGLRTNIAPSLTPLLTPRAINNLQACGISRMAISLDGPDSPSHDGFRRVNGSFDRAIQALRHARNIGLDTQILTTVSRWNFNHLAELAERVAEVRSRMWNLFFPGGPGPVPDADNVTAEEYEQVFEFLYDISKVAPFEVKTTEAMHYRRYIAERVRQERRSEHEGTLYRSVFRTAGVSDARGFVFVSHTGEIFPSGFLPLSAGNVKRDSIVDVYRNSSMFRTLRDPAALEGKCASCEYTRVCGGSRSRAYALTGNYLAADPRCAYEPQRNTAHAEAAHASN